MTQQSKNGRRLLVPGLIGIAILAVAVFLFPRRIHRVVPTDSTDTISPDKALLRSVVWGDPAELTFEQSNAIEPKSPLITPRMTPDGSQLVFGVRTRGGHVDLFQAQRGPTGWRDARPISSLNSESDESGAVVSADGRRLYFHSDRAGGLGGFDLYVASRTNGGWSQPKNLGPEINSIWHEYDPAVNNDESTIYFSSNQAERQPATEDDADQKADRWKSTIRSDPGRATFDLFVAHRDGLRKPWRAAIAARAANSPRNEGSPFLSPDGAFLYFSSDRSVRPDEDANLDLFRLHLAGVNPVAEHLGNEINTSSHETEPALSPEGFTLLFSSDRNGVDRLYSSRATEVFVIDEWDASRVEAAVPIVMVGIGLGLLWMLIGFVRRNVRTQQPVRAATGGARFFVLSMLAHVVLIAMLAAWTLPEVVQAIVSRKFEADPSTQLFDDNQHQSHEDGREAYEKLADLKSVDAKAPEFVRQETERLSIDSVSDDMLPAIDIPARNFAVPPDQVIFMAQRARVKPQEAEAQTQLARATPRTMPGMQDLVEAEVKLTAPGERAPELPIETTVDVARAEPDAEPVRTAIANPDAQALRESAATAVVPQAVQLAVEITPATIASNPLETRTDVNVDMQAVELDDTFKLTAAPVTIQDNSVPGAPAPKLKVAKSEATSANPATVAVEGAVADIVPKRSTDVEAIRSKVESRPLGSPETKADVPRSAPAGQITEIVADLDIDAADIELVNVEMPADEGLEGKTDSDGVELEIARVDVPAVAARPLTSSGPNRQLKRNVVGTLAMERNLTAPSLNPIGSRLDRAPAKAAAVAMAYDNVGLRSMFTLRQGDVRQQYIELFGGTEETEKAVNRGLEWLAIHQNEDGSWSLHDFHKNCDGKHAQCSGAGATRSNTAATGLSLLPFLAAGNTHQDGPYKENVAKALTWLKENQKETGLLQGVGDSQPMYSHGIATIALCEIYGMTQDAEVRPICENALKFIVAAQHAGTGGWRYNPNEAGDTSVVGWQMMALKSGEMAGIAPPAATLANLHKWLESVEGNQPIGGVFGYQSRGPSPGMSAEGLLCLQFLNTRRNAPEMRAGADYLLQYLPQQNQSRSSYYWYYGTQVMYHMQGHYWTAWNDALSEMLVLTQDKNGALAGTWAPVDSWEKAGGRIYSTSIKLLMLEIYYRHLPLYDQLNE